MTAPDPGAEDRVGSVLHDKWTLERLLGVGGMGAVYAARHRNGARAAVKVLSPSMGRLPQIRKRFLHEGYAANRVDHAGAVRVLDDDVIPDGTDEGLAYLVMELLEGESLGERAKREPPLSEKELLELADGVLAVLESAHTNGVVHRDLKPDNLFLARDAESGNVAIKVLDFGLARLAEAQEQTFAGMAVGTPTYMSPEQAAGRTDQIDGRTDIYALGSILFQLATHKQIHDAAHTLGLVVRMATMPAPKVRTVRADVTEPFARIVDRALAFEREQRYPTAAAMRADVQAALTEGPASHPHPVSPAFLDTVQVPAVGAAAASPALGEAAGAGAGARSEAAVRATKVEVPLARVGRRPPSVASRAWLLVVALVGFGGVLWLHDRFARPPAPSTPTSSSSSSARDDLDAAPPALDASGEPVLAAAGFEDAGVAPLVFEAPTDEPIDASADASDEDDEEDDDEELDASAVPMPSASPTPVPRSGPRPVAKPTKKKHPPRRPGQPRRRRRWRH